MEKSTKLAETFERRAVRRRRPDRRVEEWTMWLECIIKWPSNVKILAIVLRGVRIELDARGEPSIHAATPSGRGRLLAEEDRDALIPLIVQAEIALHTGFPEHASEIEAGMRALVAQLDHLADPCSHMAMHERLVILARRDHAQILESTAQVIASRRAIQARASDIPPLTLAQVLKQHARSGHVHGRRSTHG